MTPNLILIFLVIAYFSVLLIITAIKEEDQGFDSYVIGNRQVGLWGIVTSLSANARDASAMALWIGFAALYGFGASWLLSGFLAGNVLIAYFAPKIRQEAADQDYISLDDLFRHRIGKWTGMISAFIISLAAILWAAGNLNVAGILTSNLFEFDDAYGILAVTICVAIYLLVGGYKNIIRTDLFQGFLIFAIALLIYFIYPVPSIDMVWDQIMAFPKDLKIGFFIFANLFGFVSPDVWQRLFSAKDPKTARYGFLATIPFFGMIMVGVIIFGMAMFNQFPDENPMGLFLAIFAQDNISPYVIVLLGLFTLTAAMSTLDTQTYIFSSTIMQTIFSSDNAKKAEDDYIGMIRIIMLGMLVAMAIIASFIGDIVSYLIDGVTVFMVLAPVLFYSLISRPNKHKLHDIALALTLIIATALHFAMFFAGVFDTGILYNLIPTGISALLTTIFAIYFKGTRFHSSTLEKT